MSIAKAVTSPVKWALTSFGRRAGYACLTIMTALDKARIDERNEILKNLRGMDERVSRGIVLAYNHLRNTNLDSFVVVSHKNNLLSAAKKNCYQRSGLSSIPDSGERIESLAVASGVIMAYQDITQRHLVMRG